MIVNENNPDLDRPQARPTPLQVEADQLSKPLVIMSEFRRIRESTTSLLRALPDNAWERQGFSRRERNWSVRELAEYLAVNDRKTLREIDRMLDRKVLDEESPALLGFGLMRSICHSCPMQHRTSNPR